MKKILDVLFGQNKWKRLWKLPDYWFRRLFNLKKNWLAKRDVVANNYELGLRYFDRQKYKDSVFRLEIVVKFAPEHANAWYYLGRSYQKLGHKPRARTAFRKAAELDPTLGAEADLAALG